MNFLKIYENTYFRISLQFFSDDEDDEEIDENGENGEGAETGNSDVSAPHNSNPLVDRVRGKAQNMYNESGARDKLNEIGSKAGNSVSGATGKVGDAVGGKAGDALKGVGKIGNDKLSHLGDSVGNKIGGNDGDNQKSVGEQATDKAIDKGAEVAGKVAEKGAEAAATASGIPGGKIAGKAIGAAVTSFIKSKTGKTLIKGCGLGCLGALGSILLIVVILFAFFGELMAALGGMLLKGFSTFLLMLTFRLFDLSFHDRVEKQLDAIYSSVQEFPQEDKVDLEEGVKRPELENSTTKSDSQFAYDFAENIPRERMKRYVQAEYSTKLYVERPLWQTVEIDIPALYDALAKANESGEVGLGTRILNELSDINILKAISPIFGGTKNEYEDNINDVLEKYKDTMDISYDLSSVDDSIKDDLENYIKNNETISEGTEKKVNFPENLDVILDEFPSAVSFFGPLEMSTGNPIIYRGEDIVAYSKYVQDGEGKVNEEESVLDEKAIADLKKNIKEGDVITGNPSNVIMKLPNFYSDKQLQGNIQEGIETVKRLLGMNSFDDKSITRAFVMDIARLIYSNPEHGNRPTNITIAIYSDTVENTTTETVDVEYNGAIYSIPKTTVHKTITPVAYIKKVEDWDRKVEYEYTVTTSDESVENIIDETGNIIGNKKSKTTTYASAGPAKITVTPYVQKFIDEYRLEAYDYGIYYELTGRDFLDNATLYGTISSEEYEALFLDSGYCYPIASFSERTSDYGYRTINGKTEFHTGIDLVNDYGTPILAFADGTVEEWRTGQVRDPVNGGYGNYIKLKHVLKDKTTNEEKTIYTIYAHLKDVTVSPLAKGTKVTAGQQIGTMGNTGRTISKYTGATAGTHLHFEMRNAAGETINPLNFLNNSPVDSDE